MFNTMRFDRHDTTHEVVVNGHLILFQHYIKMNWYTVSVYPEHSNKCVLSVMCTYYLSIYPVSYNSKINFICPI